MRQALEQLAKGAREASVGICQDARQAVAYAGEPLKNHDAILQEQAPDVALDQATVNSTGVTVKLTRDDAYPPGTFTNCIVTKEFSTLEKGSTEQKSYCPGIGNVLVEEHHGKVFRSELTGGADPLRFRTR